MKHDWRKYIPSHGEFSRTLRISDLKSHDLVDWICSQCDYTVCTDISESDISKISAVPDCNDEMIRRVLSD